MVQKITQITSHTKQFYNNLQFETISSTSEVLVQIVLPFQTHFPAILPISLLQYE